MTDDTEHPEIAELLLPYSLRQLDDAERARVEAALDADPDLRAELEALEATAARMVASLPRVSAPPQLRARVFDAIGAAEKPASLADARDLRARRAGGSRFGGRLFAPAAAGVLAVACVVLALTVVGLRSDLSSTERRLDRLRDAGAAPAPARGLTTHAVDTSGPLDAATGVLVHVDDNTYVLSLRNMPDAGQGRSWQVWSRDTTGRVRNIGIWTDDARTHTLVVDSGPVDEVMVSLEQSTEPVDVPSSGPVADVRI